VLSVLFLILSAKAFLAHFYNDVRHQNSVQKARVSVLPKIDNAPGLAGDL
jgi:hypothetical protein